MFQAEPTQVPLILTIATAAVSSAVSIAGTYLAFKKWGTEKGATELEILKGLRIAYQEVRVSEESLFKRNRELQLKLDQCFDEKGDCGECIDKIKELFKPYDLNPDLAKHAEFKKFLGELREQIEELSKN